ncbi:hypothetical protein [Nocardia goodfellowii]|uniref:Uncharacterized protein n=1 Tax=Nocardia goodfellowii TaxID=882446 RepID=A0ABS4QK10_9NOCA|nr:hypothetical protein [Nocardia goodfellowii]MBP2191379.1 hypothetical protein [Nocardia goodfellowii]
MWPGLERADKPTEEQAGVQTGYGIKMTGRGQANAASALRDAVLHR